MKKGNIRLFGCFKISSGFLQEAAHWKISTPSDELSKSGSRYD
jgi:hypothetical protein